MQLEARTYPGVGGGRSLPRAVPDLAGAYMARQRWYAGDRPPEVLGVVDHECLAELPNEEGSLWWALVRADGSEYQLLIAERPAEGAVERAKGHEAALLGALDGRTFYDALVDNEMALALLAVASGGAEKAERSRPLLAEQSNSSVIYDDRIVLKVFRRLAGKANPDVEVTTALAAAGFSHIAKPLVRWQRQGRDLAFGQEYLVGGTDGWALALTSLRDYYGTPAGSGTAQPAMSGGDLAAEARRLGQVTAEMHLAMAVAYGSSDALATNWRRFVAGLREEVQALVPQLARAAATLLDRIEGVAGTGLAVRVHGDYHLGQVMRTDSGWYVLDFEGEPNRPLEERLRPTSVMKDVAGMLRSLQYAARFVLGERGGAGASELAPLARAWEERNCAAFLQGYYGVFGMDELLPAAPDREAVRVAFELDKALYELRYERAFRPAWASIPEDALGRMLTAPVEELLAPPGAPADAGTTEEASDA